MLGYTILVAVSLVVFLFVLQPLISARSAVPAGVSARVADLQARRRYLLDAIRDVDFDRQVGKLNEQEYQEIRDRYLREAAVVIRELDHSLSDVDQEIEHEIAALRAAARARQRADEDLSSS